MARLRAKGWSYGAIGKRLGISRQAVHRALTAPLRQPVGLSPRGDASYAAIDFLGY
jgi:hypothetical protein